MANMVISAFSFFLCLVVASQLQKLTAFSFLNSRPGRFLSLDGLRGLAAYSVFVHHFVVTYYWKVTGIWADPPEAFFRNLGPVGVSIFFMITGFLFIGKITIQGDRIIWIQVFLSRVFRIYPLYLFAVSIIFIVAIIERNYYIEFGITGFIFQVSKWLFFHGSWVNNFEDTRLILARVDWTLRFEWVFYLSLPLLYYILSPRQIFFSVLLVALCLVFFLYPVKIGSFSSEYFILFAIGGVCHWALKYLTPLVVALRKFRLGDTLAVGVLAFSLVVPSSYSPLQILFVSIFFGLVVGGVDLFGLLSARSAKLVGEVSYSIYLLHGITLYVVFTIFAPLNFAAMSLTQFMFWLPIFSGLLLVATSITFLFIERPFIKLSRRQ